uniref:Uncharacterized protein n=1 Tax=Plectus sambesii TaxID=2011161 RepID=A0A914XCH2_9BILA
MGDLIGPVLFDDAGGGRFVSWKVSERGRVVPGMAVLEYEVDGLKKKLKTDPKGIAYREKKLKAGDQLTLGLGDLDRDGKLFGKRILSRDECFDPTLKTANLK